MVIRFILLVLLAGEVLPAQSPALMLGDRLPQPDVRRADTSDKAVRRTWQPVQYQVGIFTDTSGVMDWRAVAALPDHFFRRPDAPCCLFKAQPDSLWLRLPFVNRFEADSVFYLEVVNPFIRYLSFFHLDKRGRLLDSIATGALLPFRTRGVEHRNFLFKAVVPPGDTAWFYLALRPVQALDLRVVVWTREEHRTVQQRSEDVLLTIFFVFTTMYLLLSGMLIAVTRQYDQWFYFAYVLLTGIFIAAHLGLGARYVWYDAPALQFILPAALHNLRIVFGIEFFRRYYGLAQRSPAFNRFIDATIIFFLITTLLQLLNHWFEATLFDWILRVFFVYLILFSVAMLGWILLQVIRRRWRRASWLFLVVALHFAGLAGTSLQYMGFRVPDPLILLLPAAYSARVDTLFLQTSIMSAFFAEMVLVFYFSTRRYIGLYDKEQRAMVKVARAREEGLTALLLGVENERQRIARDLHDGACVNLAAIRMKLDALGESAAHDALAADLADIGADLESTYRELRGLSHDLMSHSLEKTDLPMAIEDLVTRVQRAKPGLQIDLYINFELEKIVGMTKIHLFRILQELLGNIIKHAEATRATVQLLNNDGRLLLTVEDDGRGFDPAAINHDGIGLQNVRARVQLLHAALHLDARPGKGTFVSIEL